MDQEQIVLQIDETPAVAAVARANAAMDKYEQGVKVAAGAATSHFERHGETIVRIVDRSRSSLEKQVSNVEKLARTYGATGVEKLIIQQDEVIKRLGSEQQAIDRVRAAYGKMIEIEKERDSSATFRGVGEKAAGFVEQPLSATGRAIGGVLEQFGSFGAIAAGAAAAIAAVGGAGLKAAKSLGEYGTEIRDVQLRTGLSTKEVVQFSFAAQSVGKDVSIFERSMRGLSKALEDNSAAGEKARNALTALGVHPFNIQGDLKPTSEILLQISEGLNRLPNAFERNKLALDVFGKSAIEAIPAFVELRENVARAKELGLGPSEEDVERWREYQHQVTEIDAEWERLKRNVKEPLAATVIFTIKTAGNFLDKLGLSGPKPSSLGEKTSKDLEEDRQRDAVYRAGGAETVEASTRSLRNYLKNSLQGAQQELQRLKTAYDEAYEAADKIAKAGGVLPEVSRKAREEVQKTLVPYQHQLELVKDLQKAESDRRAIPEEQRRLIEKLNERAAAPYGLSRTQALVAEFKQRPGVTPQQVSAFEHSPQVIAGNKQDYDLALAKFQAQSREALQKAAALTTLTPQPRTAEEYSKQDEARRIAQQKEFLGDIERENKLRQQQQAVIEKSLEFDRQRREVQEESAVKLQATISPDTTQAAQLRQAAEIAGIKQRYINEQYAYELDKVNSVARYIEDADERRQELRIKREEDLSKLQIDLAEKAASVYRSQLDSIKGEAEGLFHTLFTDPRKFGAQLSSTLRNAFLKPIEEGLANITARAIHPIVFGPNGQGGIAGGLHNIFGGNQSPQLEATDHNTQALGQLRNAVAGLTLVMHAVAAQGLQPIQSPTPQFLEPSRQVEAAQATVEAPFVPVQPVQSPTPQNLTQNTGVLPGQQGLQALLANIPHFAEGAVVNQPTLGLFGESGPEAVIPIGQGGWLDRLKELIGLKHQDSHGSIEGPPPARIAGGMGVSSASGALSLPGGNAYTDLSPRSQRTSEQQRIAEASAIAPAAIANIPTQPNTPVAHDQVPAAQTPVGQQDQQSPRTVAQTAQSIAQSPLGLIGESILGVSLAHTIVEPEWHKAERFVKQTYGIKISHTAGDSIAKIADERYHHDLRVAVRSEEVREMLGIHTLHPSSAVYQQSGSSLPSYDAGGIMPDDGPKYLHKGEAVIPAELTGLLESVAGRAAAPSQSKDASQLVNSLDALRIVMGQNVATSYGLSRVVGAGLGIPAFAAPSGISSSGVSIPNVSSPSSDNAPLSQIAKAVTQPVSGGGGSLLSGFEGLPPARSFSGFEGLPPARIAGGVRAPSAPEPFSFPEGNAYTDVLTTADERRARLNSAPEPGPVLTGRPLVTVERQTLEDYGSISPFRIAEASAIAPVEFSTRAPLPHIVPHILPHGGAQTPFSGRPQGFTGFPQGLTAALYPETPVEPSIPNAAAIPGPPQTANIPLPARTPTLSSYASYDQVPYVASSLPQELPGIPATPAITTASTSLNLPFFSSTLGAGTPAIAGPGIQPGGELPRPIGPAGAPSPYGQVQPYVNLATRLFRPGGGGGFQIPGLNTNAGGFEQGPTLSTNQPGSPYALNASGGPSFGGFSLGGFKQFLGIGQAGPSAPSGVPIPSVFGDEGGDVGTPGTFPDVSGGTSFSSVAGSPAVGAAGIGLAELGLSPSSRYAGSAAGVALGTVGGAAVGFQYGGPVGAAIGAGVGFGIGLGELVAGVEPPWKHAENVVRQIYHINIPEQTGQEIVNIANQSYGGQITVAVRSPQVRQMLGLFAAGTNQKFPVDADQPHAFNLVQEGGTVYQQASNTYGNLYSYQSQFSVAGGYSTTQLPNIGQATASNLPVAGTPNPSSSQGSALASITHNLQLDGPSTISLLRGEVAQVVSPDYTADSLSDAWAQSNGRLDSSALMNQPGLIIS